MRSLLLIRIFFALTSLVLWSLSAQASAPWVLKLDLSGTTSASAIDMVPTSLPDGAGLQRRLIQLALEHVELTHVPYVWGGARIGSMDECVACRQCVRRNNIALEERSRLCKECRKCGMDCSHFVHSVYANAGLDYPYASSRELAKQTSPGIFRNYNLVDLGRNLQRLQPGDLVVYPRHIVMVTRVTGLGRADIVHISRYRQGPERHVGGFRLDQDVDLDAYRGGFVRVLRHRRLIDPTPQWPVSGRQLLSFATPSPPFRTVVG